MKSIKSIHSFLKKIRVIVTKNHYLGLALVKAVILAAVLVPGALQASVIVSVEVRQDFDDGCSVLFKRGTQSVDGGDAIMKRGNLGSKDGLELKSAVTQQSAPLAPTSKVMNKNDSNKTTNDGDDSSDYWDWYLYGVLPFLMWLPILLQPMMQQPNVKLTGSPASGESALNDGLG